MWPRDNNKREKASDRNRKQSTISLVFSSILLQLIVLFLPTQLGLHFWPDFSRAAGIKVDYLSPTLFFMDILLVLYFLVNFNLLYGWIKKHLPPITVFLTFVGLNILFAISPENTALWWLRWLLYLLFFLALRLRKVTWAEIKNSLTISVVLVVFLEILQVIQQSSTGGVFYWLGERTYSSSTSGLGRLSLFGLDFVRPQSTFSHPNSLGGYLLLIYYLFHLNKSPLWSRIIIFVGLLLTFSKAALLAFLLVITFHLNSVLLIILFISISLLQLFLTVLPGNFQFITDRLFWLRPTKEIIISRPLFGTGLGGFIPALAEVLPGSFLLTAKLQPVHNLLLLIISELGLVGSALLGLYLKINTKKLLRPAILGLLALVLITGAFDHYWWTLAQNKLILLFAVALLL